MLTTSGDPGSTTSKAGKTSIFATTLAGIDAVVTAAPPPAEKAESLPVDVPSPTPDVPTSASDQASVVSSVYQTEDLSIAMQIDQTPSAASAPAATAPPPGAMPTFALPPAQVTTSPDTDDAPTIVNAPANDQGEPVQQDDKSDQRGKRSSDADAAQMLSMVGLSSPAPAMVVVAARPSPKSSTSATSMRNAAPAGAVENHSAVPAQPVSSAKVVDDGQPIAPALAALAEVVAAAQDHDQAPAHEVDPKDVSPSTIPTPIALQTVREPSPATAAIMTARAAATPKATTVKQETKHQADEAERGSTEGQANQTDLPTPNAPALVPSSPARQAPVATLPSAGHQLAAGTADRQLDLAKQGAWLDGLARDIAATGSSGTLRFEVAPQHLGAVQVEVKQSADGAMVTLTASSEASRALLDQAKPQLVAEARAHGIAIAGTQVDVGHSGARAGGDSQQNGGNSPEPRPDSRADSSVSSQAGGRGNDNGRSQTQWQPIAVNQDRERRANAPIGDAEADAGPARDDGLYA
jgi:flagellar hook-length control protein FliK